MHHLTRTRRAFTLLELIVTIVVLGVLALLAIPTFDGLIGKSEEATAVSSSESMIRSAQALESFDRASTWSLEAWTTTGDDTPTAGGSWTVAGRDSTADPMPATSGPGTLAVDVGAHPDRAGVVFHHGEHCVYASVGVTGPATLIVEPAEPADVCTARNIPVITGFMLVNSVTDGDLRPIQDGETIVGNTSQLTLRAVVAGPTVSVAFDTTGTADDRIEEAAPFFLGGDTGGNSNAWSLGYGTHTVTATAYNASGASGMAGPTETITFTVVAP